MQACSSGEEVCIQLINILLIELTLCRVKLLLPPTEGAPEGDSFQVIGEKALEAGVLALPGKAFFMLDRASPCTSIPDFGDHLLTPA
jgi:hypothetical protein